VRAPAPAIVRANSGVIRRYDPRAQREVARAGYQLAVTTEVGLNNERNDPPALRRVHGEYDLARFVKNTSGFAQAQ